MVNNSLGILLSNEVGELPLFGGMATNSKPDIKSKKITTVPDWRDAVAGACAGAFSRTVMAPVERVKLMLQLQGSVKAVNHENQRPPLTVRRVVRQIYDEEGILAFWRGNVPNVLRTAGQAGLNFALMDYYKKVAVSSVFERHVIQRRHNRSDEDRVRLRKLTTSFISGGLAGGTATTLLYPVEYMRTRLAMDQGSTVSKTRSYPGGMRDVLSHTLRADGITGLYQGYGVALFGGVLYRLLYLGGYDALKEELDRYKQLQRKQGSRASDFLTLTWGERFLVAQSVSLTAGTICYPIDSVRRRMMMQAGLPIEQRQYQGSIHCFRVVWAKEGLKGFYLGIGPNIVRSVGGALALVIYDVFKAML